MYDAEQFRELASGRRQGVWPATLRYALSWAELPYAWGVKRRNREFDTGKREIHRVGVPVISVGNITVGGTGKTPVVLWLANWFRRRGVKVAIVSRGYGAEAGGKNDEALELEQRLPDVPHIQNPDRVAAAQTAIEEFESQLILLDDAFQHRRIARDLDIVLLDALEPFGYGHLLPRGLLREPLAGLARADVVALTRADIVDAHDRLAARHCVDQHAPNSAWVELSHTPQTLLNSSGVQQTIHSLSRKHVAGFCGIGNPHGFSATLEQSDLVIAAWREFPDHYDYQREDVQQLAHWLEGEQVAAAVCTYKDLVKIGVDRLGDIPLWALVIGIEPLFGLERLEAKLQPILDRIAASPAETESG